MNKITQKEELQLLRSYYRQSEKRRLIGTGEYKPHNEYKLNIFEQNEALANMKRVALEINKKTTLLVDIGII